MTATFCTAVATHELALARVLASGLARSHPDVSLVVLLLDGDPGSLDDEPFEVVSDHDVDVPGLALLQTATRGPRDLAASLRPALMSMLLERHRRPVVWLDPTVRVLRPLEPLPTTAADLALVPVRCSLGGPPSDVRRAPFASGAMAANDRSSLDWWAELILERAKRLGAGFDAGADDALSDVAAASDGVTILRHPGLLAGWWSIAAGGRIGDGPTLDGRPLQAFNLVGFDPTRPHWLTDEDPDGSVRVSRHPSLAAMLAQHADDLLTAGWEPSASPWRYAVLPNGLPIDDDMRDLFAAGWGAGAVLDSPFTEVGCEGFMSWLDSESPTGGGVTRYLERVHRRRPDLKSAFPDLGGGDNQRLAEWMYEHGAKEEPVIAGLLRRRPPVERSPAPSPAFGPRHGRRAAAVKVVGYLRDGLGLGQAARSYAHALSSAGADVETVSLRVPIGDRADDRTAARRDVEWEDRAGGGRDAVEIVCMNPPELMRAHRSGAVSAERAYRIGVWAWELDTLPAGWSEAFPLVDEVWAYSRYVAEALRAQAPVHVEVMPLAIDIPPDTTPVDGDPPFTFLFLFDFHSSIERKNPLGLIDAFKRAFEPGEARLLLKTHNGDNEPEDLERVRVAALGRPDIEVRDEFLPAPERDALIAGCDCYVSLHRAEGFGLTIAEAMAAARPVVATGFSGNLDFMRPGAGYLVDWRPAEVQPGSLLYPAGARWAEPDLDHAARLMRAVYEDPAAAAANGRAARAHVERLLAPAVVGARARERLGKIEPRRPGGIIRSVARRIRP